MRHFSYITRLSLSIYILLLVGCTFAISPTVTQSSSTRPVEGSANATHYHISNVALLGVITVPYTTRVQNTLVGGLSAIAYDKENGDYYFLSDDRGITGPVRIYQAAIDLSDGSLDKGDLTWVGLIRLEDETGAPFAQGTLDPEGLVYTGEQFYVASEGDTGAQPPVPPAIMEFTPTGRFVETLPLPEKFLPQPNGSRGVRDNKGFESLTRSPNGRYLITGVENALVQDGPAATLEYESPARLLKIDLMTDNPVAEYLYVVDPIPVASKKANGDADNGLTELVALDNNGTLLALERAYAQGVGNTVRLYLASTEVAQDVSTLEALLMDGGEGEPEPVEPVTKELVVDFGELGSNLGIAPDNLEGMALGPQLPDGWQLLMVVSDNNFSPGQTTQLWALALTLEAVAPTSSSSQPSQ